MFRPYGPPPPPPPRFRYERRPRGCLSGCLTPILLTGLVIFLLSRIF